MKKEDKSILIDSLAEAIVKYNHFYITDISGFNAERTYNLRKKCFQNGIKLVVVKNTLFKCAMAKAEADFEPLYDVMKGSSAIMFCENANAPARLIKELKGDKANNDKPILKAAYVQEGFYFGEQDLEALITLKSREELIGEIIGLLQSPVQNVLSALQSGGNTIHGVLKTLGERNA